jgi:hypothetical protein
MRCERCDGLLVIDHYIDIEESGGLWIEAWRCTSCGNVIDHQIARHHTMANPPVHKRNLHSLRKQTPLESAVWL